MKLKKKPQWTNNRADDSDAAFNRALRYLSLRARSQKEIEEYLVRKQFNPPAISQAVKKLLDLKFLNDEEYGKSFTRSRQVYKGRSRFLVSYELKQKGVAEETVSKVLSESQEDIQTAKDFIERKKRVYANLDKLDFKNKMIRLLSARGFSYDTIKKVLKEEE